MSRGIGYTPGIRTGGVLFFRLPQFSPWGAMAGAALGVPSQASEGVRRDGVSKALRPLLRRRGRRSRTDCWESAAKIR